MPTLSFDRINKVIIVPDTATEVTIQEIYDQARQYENEPISLDLESLVSAGGKDDLGGDVYTAVTATLINNWRLQFEARVAWTTCYVKGGNLVAINDYGNEPIKTSTYVNVIMLRDVGGTIAITGSGITEQDKLDIADRVWDELTSGHLTTDTFGMLMSFIYGIDGGRWKIDNNQMVFYEADNETEVARFNLYDAAGQPAEKDVFERRRA